MQLDFEDILAGSFGRILALSLFFVSAIWLGSLIGGLALEVGSGGIPSPSDFVETPLLLINLWIVPNVGLLAMMVVYLLVTDSFGYAAWGIIVGLESLFAMLGWGLGFNDPWEGAKAWACWLILLTMLETGVWLIWQTRRNQWARELAELSAENAMRRAERESRASEEADTEGGGLNRE